VAREIAAGIGSDAEVVDAASAPNTLPPDVSLVVVGGLTHAISLSTASTREAGAAHLTRADTVLGRIRLQPAID
jgi:hypothetical protein